MKGPINILILGSGGREHALAWKIAQSPHLGELYIAPGNGGTEAIGSNVDLDILDVPAISTFVNQKRIDLLLIGPEVPLVEGLVDRLTAAIPSLMIIGPTAAGAQLEGSKAFAKAFMARHQIPTASYRSFGVEEMEDGLAYIDQQPTPIVLKADGLAAGKGVIISTDRDEAKQEFKSMLAGKFGAAGKKVVIESFLEGIEFSVFVLTDGTSYCVLPVAKDYKRIGEGDTGLNTGGMGSISPVGFVDAQLMSKVAAQIIQPTIDGLKQENIDYRGFIFFGLINVNGDPFVIEYNCRMGDPETQSVLPRLGNDLVELCVACAEGSLDEEEIKLEKETVATIVMVSGGYPGAYQKGLTIDDLPEDSADQFIFHAGTTMNGERLVTNGGRVLAVTSIGDNLTEALARSNQTASQISFKGAYYRKDIGFDLAKS